MNPPTHHEPGEDMNVRTVHGALWRELAEPIERWRRTPWYLRHFYAIMAILRFFTSCCKPSIGTNTRRMPCAVSSVMKYAKP